MSRSVVYFFIFVFVVLTIVFVEMTVNDKFDRSFANAEKKLKKENFNSMFKVDRPVVKISPAKPVEPVLVKTPTAAELKVTAEFIDLFKHETAEISRPQEDVEKTELRLQSWARHLSQDEINYLAEVMFNQEKNGDERALALSLLGRNQSTEALSQLKNFVLSNAEQTLRSRARIDEEMVFKVQAVEDIAASGSRPEARSYLNEIENRTDQAFIKDRVQRSLSYLNGTAPSPEVQDNEALEKIIE